MSHPIRAWNIGSVDAFSGPNNMAMACAGRFCWCFPHPYAIHSSSAGRVSTTEMANQIRIVTSDDYSAMATQASAYPVHEPSSECLPLHGCKAEGHSVPFYLLKTRHFHHMFCRSPCHLGSSVKPPKSYKRDYIIMICSIMHKVVHIVVVIYFFIFPCATSISITTCKEHCHKCN